MLFKAFKGIARIWTSLETVSRFHFNVNSLCSSASATNFNINRFVQADVNSRNMSVAVDAVQRESESQNAKPFSAIPGPPGLPIIGNALSLPYTIKSGKRHLINQQRFAEYGPIYKETIFVITLVYLSDVDAIRKLFSFDGKYPRRIHVSAWKEWRKQHGHKTGILITDGPDWKRMRTTLDKRMLRPKHVATYADNFNEVITDFVAHIRRLRDEKGGGKTVPNIAHELFHWSLETICTVLYDVRLGGLSENRQPRMTEFINAVQNVFISLQSVFFLPSMLNRIFFRKHQKMHEESWATVFSTTEYLIEKKLKKLKAQAENGDVEQEPSFLSFLLSTDMSLEEIYGNISELMLAAVDTTSNTFQWVLYELARHPEIQKRLYDEVMSVLPNGELPSYDNIQQMRYLRAIVKEVLRMYPVAAITTRLINEDLVLCGYHIPQNTTVMCDTYQLGHDPKMYPDPEQFRPERWLRTKDTDHIHTFAWLPFGFGSRMCAGRRIAELEMHLLLARISREFELKADDKPLLPKSIGLLVPERPVNVTFIDRL